MLPFDLPLECHQTWLGAKSVIVDEVQAPWFLRMPEDHDFFRMETKSPSKR